MDQNINKKGSVKKVVLSGLFVIFSGIITGIFGLYQGFYTNEHKLNIQSVLATKKTVESPNEVNPKPVKSSSDLGKSEDSIKQHIKQDSINLLIAKTKKQQENNKSENYKSEEGKFEYSVKFVDTIKFPKSEDYFLSDICFIYYKVTLFNNTNKGITDIVGEISAPIDLGEELLDDSLEPKILKIKIISKPGIEANYSVKEISDIQCSIKSLNPKEKVEFHILLQQPYGSDIIFNYKQPIFFRSPKGFTATLVNK